MTERRGVPEEQFMAAVSHELRGSLHAILGLSEVLATSELPEADADIARALHKEAQAMRVLVDDIVTFGAVGSGVIPLASEPFSPRATARMILDGSRAIASTKSLRLLLAVEAVVPRLVSGDSVRFGQVIRNLVENAVRFTDHGSIDVRLGYRDDLLLIEVSDTGRGIAEDQLADIFEPFVRAGNPEVPGTGLGLAVVDRIVTEMGGEISVQSEIGVGTTFTCHLPFRPAVQSDTPVERETPGPRGTVLVVEDSAVNRLVAVQQLDALGLESVCVESAEEAFEVFRDRTFDLVLMDWNLPGMDGPEAARTIRDEGLLPAEVPIIAMTANVLTGDREFCLAAGMNDYLPKPVMLDDIHSIMQTWLPAAEAIDRSPASAGDIFDTLGAELGDRELARIVLQSFLDELPERRRRLADPDPQRVDEARRAAHTLRSTSTLVGAQLLADLCSNFESNSQPDDLIREQLDEEIQRLSDVLTNMLNGYEEAA